MKKCLCIMLVGLAAGNVFGISGSNYVLNVVQNGEPINEVDGVVALAWWRLRCKKGN